ncbi:hypothetical protein [Hoyosella altamirensis]|uniref:Seryl-tRNA synthetase n=1 Tax=Hoyosella altamirensis TaxID=616997 RepID=A0A839RU65_9ACTN|nr:hypothetical protein [Hoyosella altamirensis]MBB3039758.1 seryl-tRNA synthetase [Hoyosella altamirensis]
MSTAPGVHDFHAREGEVRFEVDSEHVEALVSRLAALGVQSLVAHPPTLEQILLRHYDDVLHAPETPDA